MNITILIEPTGEGFRAKGGEPFSLSAEGATKEEAVQNLQALIKSQLTNGAEVAILDIGDMNNPWKKMAGVFQDDPYFDEWQNAIKEYRRQVDADPDRL